MKTDRNKLELWQGRLESDESDYAGELAKMDEREALYMGSAKIKPIAREDVPDETPHVRNVIMELVEAQVSSAIPQPKVSARRREDEGLAKLIEDMLREELDRMSFEELNDIMERTVPIQGGAAYLIEWDSTQRTHTTSGEVTITALHPKQVIPQAGVYSGIEDMDHIILKLPQTKEYIKRRYGVDVSDESEEEPEIRGTVESAAKDMVTQYVAYYRNDKGGIGLYSWVGETQLEDLEDYQARRLRKCARCGAKEPAPGTVITAPPTMYGEYPADLNDVIFDKNNARSAGGIFGNGDPLSPAGERDIASGNIFEKNISLSHPGERDIGKPNNTSGGIFEKNNPLSPPDGRELGKPNNKTICPYCGASEWVESEEDTEELTAPVMRTDGSVIEPMEVTAGPGGQPVIRPTVIPYYKPDMYPVILQKNISVFGRFLGGSDVDTMASQQNTVNRLEAKMLDKILTAGSYMSLPVDAEIQRNPGEMKLIRLNGPGDKALIDVYNMEADVSQDMAMLSETYEEMRQVIGVTDSFQGRKDTTATSGTAKQFAAAQTAGRLESKRIMKNAAYQRIYEAIFRYKLAYADEPRPVTSYDAHGNRQYAQFNRYDFLKKDAAGEWYWNDQFVFGVDESSSALSSNREAMWQETRLNLQSGAFGDPTNIDTLLMFWTKMEMLHYPGAAETKANLEEIRQQQAQAAQEQQRLRAEMIAMQAQTEAAESAGGAAVEAAPQPQPAGVQAGPIQ